MAGNADDAVVSDFGAEWSRFTQESLSDAERRAIFESYFAIFPWQSLPPAPAGADVGCGSGRWAALVAPRVATLHCVDASGAALAVARQNLSNVENVVFHHASVGELPFPPASLDFAYSLGVLHHVPDPHAAVRSVVRCLKPGAPLLLYLYYAFDNRPAWFRALWRASNAVRVGISRMPGGVKQVACELIAAGVYWPLARSGAILDRFSAMPAAWPLAAYRHRSFYVMRTDALDRFGTRLEHRFTRAQIQDMMEAAGLSRISFSPSLPYWCVVGFRDAPAGSPA